MQFGRGAWATVAGIAALLCGIGAWACAGGEEGPTWAIVTADYTSVGDSAVLSPGNDTRVNLLLLRGFPIPFKVGLVEDGRWIEPNGLRAEPNFKGYVVFLLPRRA